MIFQVTASFPESSIPKALSAYMKMPNIHTGVRVTGPVFKHGDDHTVVMLTVYDTDELTDDEQVSDDIIQSRLDIAHETIPGFVCTVDTYHSLQNFGKKLNVSD